MTIIELIDRLEEMRDEHGDNTEVLLMTHSIRGIVSSDAVPDEDDHEDEDDDDIDDYDIDDDFDDDGDIEDDGDEDEDGEDDEDDYDYDDEDTDEDIEVDIVEGEQLGYGSKAAWEVAQ
jgi:hypothetical protein